MANISVSGQPIFTDTVVSGEIHITGIAGYDATWITFYEGLVKARNHSFTIYYSGGAVVKTIYFID